MVYLAILVEGGLVLLAYPLSWLLGLSSPLGQFKPEWTPALAGLLGTLPLVPLFLLIVYFPIPLFEKLRGISRDVIRPMMEGCTMVDLIGISLLAGVGEEMVFRGALQPWLAREFSPFTAIVLTAIAFGLLHALTLSYFILATFMGIYLGCLLVWTDNLLAPMMVHFLYDAFALIFLTRVWKPAEQKGEVSGDPFQEDEESEYDP